MPGMIRIGEMFPNEPGKGLGPLGPGSARAANPLGTFAQQFEATRSAQQPQSVEAFIADVDTQAKLLLKSPTPAHVAHFRDAIRRFLKSINDKLGKMEKRTDRRNRTLLILKQLDDKLAALTDSILNGQAQAIDIAASINEIRGLLLDLLI
ncbi:YaaR family protein [bacterium]|nr:YaaR family protein [bacterium]